MSSTRHSSGLLSLRFEAGSDGRTSLVRREQRFPLRLTLPLYLDPADAGMAFVVVQNPTGGMFGGDRLLMRIEAAENSQVHITTQAATKVYRTEGDESRQRVELRIGDGAFVEYMPDLLIPQGGSRLVQETDVVLAPGARFVGTELVGPGRTARGELFEYERLELRTVIRDVRSELLGETLVLDPGRRHPASRGLLGEHLYLGTMLAVAPNADSEDLCRRIDRALLEVPDALAAAGTLPSQAGAIVRVLAKTTKAALSALEEAWVVARQVLVSRSLPRRRT